jgi:hypothetical protein
MPIDPRIALAGVSPTYDFMGAFNTSRAAARTDLTNQMAQQAARDTAQRGAEAREAARTVNFMDPTAASGFLSAYGADVAEPYLAAGARAAGTSVAQAGSARAQTTQDREGRDRIRGAWGRGLVFALADSSDTGLATLRGRLIADGVPEAEADATLAQIGSMDAAVRPDFIRNLASTDKDAREAMEFVAPKPQQINRGGTIVYVDMNPYSATYNQEIRSDTVTASPNRQQVVQRADGTFVVLDLPSGQGTEATLPGGAPVVGRVPGTEGQITSQRRGQLEGQISTVNNDVIPTLDRMDELLTTGDVITGGLADQRLQAARGLALLGDRNAQRQAAATQEYQNLAKTLAAGMAKTLGSNPSDADVRLLTQVTSGMIGQETSALQATSAALRARASGLVVDAQDMLGIEAAPAGDGGGSPPRISTRAQYDALASGAPYIDPNGVRRTKQ